MPVKNRFAELHDTITEWRRDIHANPELLFDTYRTSALVEEKLRAFGCDEVVTGLGRTGVVGVIRGRKDGSGRVIGLRADMDALPIEEATGVEYASTVPGKMHACGHDGHTTMLLGAARYLAETRNFKGTVALIFQPAEETVGGARIMVEEGIMDRFGIEEVYALHTDPFGEAGVFNTCPGPIMAAVDDFEITITGKGGHGAFPHTTLDPVPCGLAIGQALQTIPSRNADPASPLVVSLTIVQ